MADDMPATITALEKKLAELQAKYDALPKDEPAERAKLLERIAKLEAKLDAKKEAEEELEEKPEEKPEPPPAAPQGWFPKLF